METDKSKEKRNILNKKSPNRLDGTLVLKTNGTNL
jgi:hypothetical protein